jgi:hypothetical protein
MKPPSSHTEALRDQQAAQVGAPNGFLVTADEFGDFEGGQQTVGLQRRHRLQHASVLDR